MSAALVAWVVGAAAVAVVGVDLMRSARKPTPTTAGPEREDHRPMSEHEQAVQHECGEILRALTREGRELLAAKRRVS